MTRHVLSFALAAVLAASMLASCGGDGIPGQCSEFCMQSCAKVAACGFASDVGACVTRCELNVEAERYNAAKCEILGDDFRTMSCAELGGR